MKHTGMNIQKMVFKFILENAKVCIKMSAEDSNKVCIWVLPPYVYMQVPGGRNILYEGGTEMHKE
jgi:hypothetical protein